METDQLIQKIFGEDSKKLNSEQKLFLEEIFYIVSGSYDSEGIIMWFSRKRASLNLQSPKELFSGEWNPKSETSLEVRSLASRLFL